jgi:AmmeMemoRadiSam system protein A
VKSSTPETVFSPAERRRLLGVARSAICEYVLRDRLPEPVSPGIHDVRRGAFATLRQAGRLRGCMGRPDSTEPLDTLVAVCAVLAATRDPRFSPVRPEEVAALGIELSILAPAWTVPAEAALEQIVPGVHGLVVARGALRGLLLPQVATEQRWGALRFLEETCRKAGLPAQAWRDEETRIELFTAEVFSESEYAEQRGEI